MRHDCLRFTAESPHPPPPEEKRNDKSYVRPLNETTRQLHSRREEDISRNNAVLQDTIGGNSSEATPPISHVQQKQRHKTHKALQSHDELESYHHPSENTAVFTHILNSNFHKRKRSIRRTPPCPSRRGYSSETGCKQNNALKVLETFTFICALSVTNPFSYSLSSGSDIGKWNRIRVKIYHVHGKCA